MRCIHDKIDVFLVSTNRLSHQSELGPTLTFLHFYPDYPRFLETFHMSLAQVAAQWFKKNFFANIKLYILKKKPSNFAHCVFGWYPFILKPLKIVQKIIFLLYFVKSDILRGFKCTCHSFKTKHTYSVQNNYLKRNCMLSLPWDGTYALGDTLQNW